MHERHHRTALTAAIPAFTPTNVTRARKVTGFGPGMEICYETCASGLAARTSYPVAMTETEPVDTPLAG